MSKKRNVVVAIHALKSQLPMTKIRFFAEIAMDSSVFVCVLHSAIAGEGFEARKVFYWCYCRLQKGLVVIWYQSLISDFLRR